jgi:hypothetical protein
VKAFTEKLGEIVLGADYFEAAYYSRRGVAPEDSFGAFTKQVLSEFAISAVLA